MWELVSSFFSSSGFVPRYECGDWSPWLIANYVVANAGIAIAYILLPLNLLRLLRMQGWHAENSRQLLLWASFILLCGLGHALDNIGAFMWPNYRVFSLWHDLTAIISLWAAFTFPWWLSQLMLRNDQEKDAERQRQLMLRMDSLAQAADSIESLQLLRQIVTDLQRMQPTTGNHS